MNHHSRKKWGLPFLLLSLSLTGCNDEGAFEAGDNGAHGGDHADIITQTYEVTVNSAGEGEVSPAKNSVSAGDLSVFSVTPYEGYRIDSVSVTKGGCPLKNVTINSLDDGQVNYTVGPVNSDCAIDVKFEDSSTTSPTRLRNVSMSVTPTDGSGGKIKLSEDGELVTSANFYLEPDESQVFWVEANDNYHLKEIRLDDSEHCSVDTLIPNEQYSVKSLSGNCQVTVDFDKVRAPLEPVEYHLITFNKEGDGDVSINPLPIRVEAGKTFEFSVTPTEQSRIVGVTYDGCTVSTTDTDLYSKNRYTSGAVESDCTITVEAEKYYTVSISYDSELTVDVDNIQVSDKGGSLTAKPPEGRIQGLLRIKVSSDQYVTFKPLWNGFNPLPNTDSVMDSIFVNAHSCNVQDDDGDGVYKTDLINGDCLINVSFSPTCKVSGGTFTSADEIQTLLERDDDESGKIIVLNNATIRQAVGNQFTPKEAGYESLLSEGRNIIFDTSCVTDMSKLFQDEPAFNEKGVSYWDTSSVTDMVGMFNQASAFNGDISNWDTSSVTDMNQMFSEATDFKGDISNWNTSSVTDMSYMFYEATAFDKDINTNGTAWDTSSVTDMSAMFSRASAFKGDISKWDTSSVTDMRAMFSRASAFDKDISKWDTSSVTDMNSMFSGATAFDKDISSWCVSHITNEPDGFAIGSALSDVKKPKWGTCPLP